MDKQNRVTKWAEWEIGAHYQWVKGRTAVGCYALIEVNPRKGYVMLREEGPAGKIPQGASLLATKYAWRNRYRKVPSGFENRKRNSNKDCTTNPGLNRR